MNKGFSLLEVMVTLLVVMLLFLASARMSVVTTRSGLYSDALTYASVLGHTRLVELKRIPPDSPDLEPGWHRDPGNPIEHMHGRYYRFWQVDMLPGGREVTFHVAWDEVLREGAKNFGSAAELKESKCPQIAFRDVMP